MRRLWPACKQGGLPASSFANLIEDWLDETNQPLDASVSCNQHEDQLEYNTGKLPLSIFWSCQQAPLCFMFPSLQGLLVLLLSLFCPPFLLLVAQHRKHVPRYLVM